MLLVSSHLAMGGYLQHEEGMVYRVNMAWRDNLDDIAYDIESLPGPVFLDNPEGRSKPPNNKYTSDQVVELYWQYAHAIDYIAVSNVEYLAELHYYRDNTDAIIVPKIETILGIHNVVELFTLAEEYVPERFIMLDHDDLLTDMALKHLDVNDMYDVHIKNLIDDCHENDIKVLRTAGVVFSDE